MDTAQSVTVVTSPTLSQPTRKGRAPSWFEVIRKDGPPARFLSEDPIRWVAGTDFYHYADGDPVSEVDPMGLDTKVCLYPSNVQPWGHIGFGLPQEGEQRTSGFYPTGNPVVSPGIIKPDTEHKPTQCNTIPASSDKDQCMLRCRLKRKKAPGNYKGLTRQCTELAVY